MRIALSTLHVQHNNYGTVLQSIALKMYLADKGHCVETVDYSPAIYKYGTSGVKSFIKRWAINVLFAPQYIIRSVRFSKFIQSYNNLTNRRYLSFEQLCYNPPVADVYVSGSDQIWNPRFPCGRDDAFYLKYVSEVNKMAYASSTGTSDLTESEYQNLIYKITDYQFVSLREKDSTEELIQYGRPDAKHVCDPVALLTAETYRRMAHYVKKERFILVYAINKDPLLEQTVDFIAKQTGLSVVAIGGFAKKCNSDEFYRAAGPSEFLGLMDKATYVVTSSFHGLMFSLIYKKQFFIVAPAINRLRLSSIMNITDTENRMINDIDDILPMINNLIEYKKVDPLFSSFIERSKEYLDESLGYFETKKLKKV